MKAFFVRSRLAAFAGAALFIAAEPAAAQLYFRPFFQPFAYTFSYDQPVEGEAPARHGSRRAVASILAREGFRLVGPLGRRGEQIVATGYSRHEGEMRFIVDPYEGRIIRGARITSEDDRGPRRNDSAEYVEPLNGSRAVVRELNPDDAPRANRHRRESPSVRRLETPTRRDADTMRDTTREAAPRRITPPKSAAPAAKPNETEAKASERRPEARAPGAAKSASGSVGPEVANSPSAVVATPVKALPAVPSATQAAPKAAASAGGAAHRAIVPPTVSSAGADTAPKPN